MTLLVLGQLELIRRRGICCSFFFGLLFNSLFPPGIAAFMWGWGWSVLALVLSEVGVGGLEGVEEETCAAEVDVVAGNADHDGSDSLLNLEARVGLGDGEGGLASAALAEVCGGAASLVMVVAEALAAHGRTAAAAVFAATVMATPGGRCGLLRDLLDDVSGLRIFRGFDGFVLLIHGYPLVSFFAQNIGNIRVRSGPRVWT
jgi:hypothetical protein